MYRARETDRADAMFRDPFARRLAGERGELIARELRGQERHSWAWVTRTFLFDQFIIAQVKHGADMVVNLAAGLDTRPYRMELPQSLKWIEVDLPGLFAYKEDLLRDERPRCQLTRVHLDLSNVSARQELFTRLSAEAERALIVTEGLLVYLAEEEVGALAEDLADCRGFQSWVMDLNSPGLVRKLQKELGAQLSQARAPLRFGPAEGPEFFRRFGWDPLYVHSLLKAAARARRVPLWMRIMATLPESSGPQGSRPWSGVCLFDKPAAQ